MPQKMPCNFSAKAQKHVKLCIRKQQGVHFYRIFAKVVPKVRLNFFL